MADSLKSAIRLSPPGKSGSNQNRLLPPAAPLKSAGRPRPSKPNVELTPQIFPRTLAAHMATNQAVIENPIINSPFDEPKNHFRFSDEGITNEIVQSRRVSSYFIPIATPKKKGKIC
jgi:hypothetical protein